MLCIRLNMSGFGKIAHSELSKIYLKNLLLFCLRKSSVVHLLFAAENIVGLNKISKGKHFPFKFGEHFSQEGHTEKNI